MQEADARRDPIDGRLISPLSPLSWLAITRCRKGGHHRLNGQMPGEELLFWQAGLVLRARVIRDAGWVHILCQRGTRNSWLDTNEPRLRMRMLVSSRLAKSHPRRSRPTGSR
jgi:hypothetical protein